MYRAGIIGTGGVAGLGLLGMHDEEDIGRKKFRASHAGGYDASDEVELAAAADIDPEKLETFCTAWEIDEAHRYTDTEAMLEAEPLDIVSICTPSMFHRDPVIAAAESNNPDVVWCEKPIASSVVDAEEMITACDDHDVELVVNHTFRFTEKLQRLRSLIQEEGLLGELHSIAAAFRMELLRNSTHLLDTLVYLTEARAARVAGFITGENEAVDALDVDERIDDSGGGGFVVLDDGTFVTVDCTVPRAASSMRYEFVGDAGKLYLNNDDGEWRYWELSEGDHVEVPLPGIEDGWTWESDYEAGFPNAVDHLVGLLEGVEANRSTGREATRSLEIIVGMFVSEFTGSQVELPLAAPLKDVTITSW